MKAPISKERILEVQRLLKAKDSRGAAQALRDLNEDLERYERKLIRQSKHTKL